MLSYLLPAVIVTTWSASDSSSGVSSAEEVSK